MMQTEGKLAQGVYALAPADVPMFYVEAPKAALFDAGFSVLGPYYQQGIAARVNGSGPGYMFVTHSHFDHCGAVAYVKEANEGLKVGASPAAAGILAKPGAQRLIGDLNQLAAGQIPHPLDYETETLAWRPFNVDIPLEDGAEVDLGGGMTVQAIATPGHTRDHMAFYIPQRGVLIGAEAAGIATPEGHIFAEFLIGFDVYIQSIEKLMMLDAEVYCQGHSLAWSGATDVKKRLQDAIDTAESFRDEVAKLLKQEDGDQEKVVQIVKKKEYDPLDGPKQNEAAYLLNTHAKVRCVAEML